MMGQQKSLYLFGGDCVWKAEDWVASDDQVRGGKSQSYLETSGSIGRFYGNLDIKTLGGAGFASQRTRGDNRSWDLSDYTGIVLDIAKADGKRYTFILKDELLSRNPENGREQATISYEYDFEAPATKHWNDKSFRQYVAWSSLTPTYRGKEKKDAKAFDPASVKRISIMMRSFFGSQEGDFSISLQSIAAVPAAPSTDIEKGQIHFGGHTTIKQPFSRWTLGSTALLTAAALYVAWRRFYCRE